MWLPADNPETVNNDEPLDNACVVTLPPSTFNPTLPVTVPAVELTDTVTKPSALYVTVGAEIDVVVAALLTVNELLVPVSAPPVLVAVMVLPLPASESETLSVRVPDENAFVTVGVMVPALVVKSVVPVNEVTVLLLTSCAVMFTLNDVPNVCVEILAMAK